MKYLILILALISFSFTEPKHVGKSGVKVVSAVTQQILGRNIGYYVTFKNNNDLRSVDGLKWLQHLVITLEKIWELVMVNGRVVI